MPYSKEISREFKALFIFLLDQSYSMDEPMANSSNRKAEELALALNGWLQNMTIACGKDQGYKDWFDIAVIGYCTDDQGTPIVEPALIGPLAGRELVSISEVATGQARMDTMTQVIINEDTGEMMEMQVQVPVWIDPKMQGGTPMCTAILKAIEIIDNWIPQHGSSFPPIVINITDGEALDGDPIQYADSLKQRATEDGQVLFFNCCVSSTPGDSFLFRGNGELMPDAFARQLFQMSSILPEPTVEKARAMGQELEPNARGMAYNADMVTLIKFLDMGTRAAALR